MASINKSNLKKHAAAIHCSGELSLVERKLSNILLLNAYDDLLTRDVHTIPSKYLLAMLGWQDSNNIDGLKETLKSLMTTIVEFNLMGDGGEIWQAMTLLSSASISDGECRYSYAKDLAVKFYKPEIFAVINIGIQKQFNSNYALTLYENCARFAKVGSTGWWEIETFRKIMGATSETYNEFKRLSSFVIKKALDEINTVSDLRVVVEYKKEKRKVTALRFLISTVATGVLLQDNDVYDAIKGAELYKRLRDHGISERLAVSWLMEEPDLVLKALNYTEDLDSKGLIKGRTAGYIRRLIETKADLGESNYQSKKQETKFKKTEKMCLDKQDKEKQKLVMEYTNFLYKESLKSLSPEQVLRLKDQFLSTDLGRNVINTTFEIENLRFLDKVAQLMFAPWLKKMIVPEYNENHFRVWLNQKR